MSFCLLNQLELFELNAKGVTKFIEILRLLVTPKAEVRLGLQLHKTKRKGGASLLNKSSRLAPASGLTKLTNVRVMILFTLFLLLKPD